MSYLAFFDFDGTLISGQSQKLLAKYLFRKKALNINNLVFLYFWFFLYKIGVIKDVKSVRKKFFLICKNWNIEMMNSLMKDFFDKEIKHIFYSDMVKIIDEHKRQGAVVVIISATLQPLLKYVKEYLNIDYAIGTKLEIKNNLYTGLINGNAIYGINKKYAVEKFIDDNGFTLKGSYFYTDHYSDIELLKIVDNPIIVSFGKILNRYSNLDDFKK